LSPMKRSVRTWRGRERLELDDVEGSRGRKG